MKRSTVVLLAFAAGMLATDAQAQERPDFSGAWTVVAPPTGRGSGGGPGGSLGSGWGDVFTVQQSSNTLTVERAFYSRADLQPSMKFRYSLDGSETRNTVLMGRGMQVQVSTTAWEGDELVITTMHAEPDAGDGQTVTCEVTQTLSLLPPRLAAWSPSLVVETTRCGTLGGPPSTTRTVYTRN
ncbi:MAG: hypothetical protein ACYSUQ_14455 [Planctomycetota bacterium]|jgi:hypothetical protein